MAPLDAPSSPVQLELFTPSEDTALCLIPPEPLRNQIDNLRRLHNVSHEEWPSHVRLLHPFVQPECIEKAVTLIQQDGASWRQVAGDKALYRLADSGTDDSSPSNVGNIFKRLSPCLEADANDAILYLVNWLRKILRWSQVSTLDRHMTRAEGENVCPASCKPLLEQMQLLGPMSWEDSKLAVLVRNETSIDTDVKSVPESMRIWGYIEPSKQSRGTMNGPKMHRSTLYSPRTVGGDTASASAPLDSPLQPAYAAEEPPQASDCWPPETGNDSRGLERQNIDRLIVSSYDVPPGVELSLVTKTILSRRALADILVLQGAEDSYLWHLPNEPRIRSIYPFSCQRPPDQTGSGATYSRLNVLVLSKYPFYWSHLRLGSDERHKEQNSNIVVASFPTFKGCGTPKGKPLVVAACHLSRRPLNDKSVKAQKEEVQRLLEYLSTNYEHYPWVIAGALNLCSSLRTLGMARHRQDISQESYSYLRNSDSMFAKYGLQDAWLLSRTSLGDPSSERSGLSALQDAHEGEQGATFTPPSSSFVSNSDSSGLEAQTGGRPQRSDRVLVNDRSRLRPNRFNLFGVALDGTPGALSGAQKGAVYTSSPTTTATTNSSNRTEKLGVRCLFEAPRKLDKSRDTPTVVQPSIQFCSGSHALGESPEIRSELTLRGIIPSREEVMRRSEAMRILERVLQCEPYYQAQHSSSSTRVCSSQSCSGPRLFLVPVGSYALGCWTSSSDIDCLCVGEISSGTFFSLTAQRLRKSAAQGIRIIRRISTLTGTLLQLVVHGFKFDLQYCCAPSLTEQFPDVLRRPLTDPVFDLQQSVLSKLKPLRDVSYLERSIPDVAQFRLAHLFLTTWARNRGLLGVRFGLFGSIHLTVLLVPICKALALNPGSPSLGDIIATFFHHYARLDWRYHAVFDPFFHFHGPQSYHRTPRDRLCLLGWHSPSLNTAAYTRPSAVAALATELSRADSIVEGGHSVIDSLLSTASSSVTEPCHEPKGQGVEEFLHKYEFYAKVSLRYWGSSSTSGARFVGWLESRCLSLLTDLDKTIPTLAPQVWPQRFTAETDPPDLGSGPRCDGCYLFGLPRQDLATPTRSQSHTQTADESIRNALRQFVSAIHVNQKYFDPEACWISADLVPQSEVSSLRIDQAHPGDVFGEHDMSSDDEDPLDEDCNDEEVNEDYSQDPHGIQNSQQLSTDVMQGTRPYIQSYGKFRSARDVMSRIKWDEALDSSDYIIGYVDRFAGTREKSLELWKSDVTDDEFIPQHRIMYFKRRSDQVTVWDRRHRVDKLFGGS